MIHRFLQKKTGGEKNASCGEKCDTTTWKQAVQAIPSRRISPGEKISCTAHHDFTRFSWQVPVPDQQAMLQNFSYWEQERSVTGNCFVAWQPFVAEWQQSTLFSQ